MAITNFGELKTAAANWLNRTDLTARIPEFVALCEAKIKRDVQRKTVYTTIDISSESTALPNDCAEIRSLIPVTGSPYLDRPLPLRTLPMLAEIKANGGGTTGRPLAFAIIDGKILVAPVPDTTYTLNIAYYQTLTPLAADADTNVVLTEAPDLYLYGTLAEAEPDLEHDERQPLWKSQYADAVDSLNGKRQREETAASYKKPRLPAHF